jgi:hypothetical protein
MIHSFVTFNGISIVFHDVICTFNMSLPLRLKFLLFALRSHSVGSHAV